MNDFFWWVGLINTILWTVIGIVFLANFAMNWTFKGYDNHSLFWPAMVKYLREQKRVYK